MKLVARRAAAIAAMSVVLASGIIATGIHASAISSPIVDFQLASNRAPAGIAPGPDGNEWFTEDTTDGVAKIDPSGTITEYSLTAGASAQGITAGPDGKMWFTEGGAHKVAKITPTGTITEYSIPSGQSPNLGIVAGPDSNLWFTVSSDNSVYRVSTTGTFTPYAVPTASAGPLAMALGPDNNLWFVESSADKVAKITTSGTITEYTLPTDPIGPLQPVDIAAGSDQNMWVILDGTNKVAKMTIAGDVLAEYPIPTASSGAKRITTGPDANLWLTESNTDQVAKLMISGFFTEYHTLTSSSAPWGIAPGPDGSIWVTENTGGKLGRITVSPSCASAGTTPVARTASSTAQFSLTGSDGTTWQPPDNANLSLTCTATIDQNALLTASADLFTSKAGYNQDLGIFVSDNGGADYLVAWKESGGFAGSFSPNAAFVQAHFAMLAGHHYEFRLRWKTNKNAPGVTIYAGAGTARPFSPTGLTDVAYPTNAFNPYAVSTSQYSLTSSDGATWQPLNPTSLQVTAPAAPAFTVVIGANADLFTDKAGYNQDLGIFVSANGGAPTLLAWKESGGFAGTLSPNAAFVKTTFSANDGRAYVFTLGWKTNRNAAGATIYAAAGNGPTYSNTSLIEIDLPAEPLPATAVSASQYKLANSDGATWQLIDAGLNIGIAPAADTNTIVGGNVDLWTANAGYNQDIGIFVSVDGGADVLLAWKESGGFAGTYSPNAAYVQAVYLMSGGHTYLFKLKWKTNKNAAGATIYAAAGSAPPFSPTRLIVELAT